MLVKPTDMPAANLTEITAVGNHTEITPKCSWKIRFRFDFVFLYLTKCVYKYV